MTAYVPDEPIGFRMDQPRRMAPVAKAAVTSAGFYVDEQERIWGDPAYDISLQCLTLVELIVRECARIVDENDFAGSTMGSRLLFDHFGVGK